MGWQDFEGNERFEIVRRLGEGGMGVVYEAIDRASGGRVALKTLRGLDPERLLGLKNEFRTLQHVEHPNLVSFGQLIEDDGQWFFTMELVEGRHFLDYVRPRPGPAGDRPTRELPQERGDRAAGPAGADEEVAPAARGGNVIELRPKPGACHLGRLRACLPALADALAALHDTGIAHRDVKASNILVTDEGRLVLLDFGLASHGFGEPTYLSPMGTLMYAPPERLAADRGGPRADMYAVGVLLYQALTGREPFAGDAREISHRKLHSDPDPPSALEQNVPADLERLCLRLMARDPSERPGAAELAAAVRPEHAYDTGPATSPNLGPSSVFVGRNHELAELAAQFGRVRVGVPRVAVVEGQSGVGKSALVARFIDDLRKRAGEAVVLNGRCYEREAVPYKAVDGVVDALCEYLLGLSDEAVRSLAPDDAELLVEVFPVLRRAAALVPNRAGERPGAVDPVERRARVFVALRSLLSHVAARAPLVVVIDDFQWADADSLSLLDTVLATPEGPALLLVATLRSESEYAAGLPTAFLRGAVRIELGPLGAEDARDLAERLVVRAGGVHTSAAVLAQEAAGHPLFIDELVRHAADRAHVSEERAPVRLEQALWSRICRLADPAREVLEAICVAGAPIGYPLLGAALGKGDDQLAQLVSALRASHLVRTTRASRGEAVEPYHDRIRESVLAHLEPLATMRHHERLALALEARHHGETDALAVHWRGSGERDKAAAYAVKAAEQADSALAFERAAHLYRLALELGAGGGEAWRLHARCADALANCGRGAEAAKAYQSAIEGADEASALEFRTRAARHLLSSGHIDDGLKALRSVLAQVGLRLPGTPRAALASLLANRARLRFRGLDFVERPEGAVPLTELQRVDVCWSVSSALSFVDTVRATDYQTRHLLQALDVGEPFRVARAVAMEAGFVATLGTGARERTARLLGVADVLAERSGNPFALAVSTGSSAMAAFLQGRFRVALDLTARCERIFRERCRDVAWELDTTHIVNLICLWFVGDLEELRRRRPVFLKEARERGDLYLECALLTGHANLNHLVRDSPDAARASAAEAMQRWTVRGFHLQHWWHMMSNAYTDLYAGANGRAHELFEREWSGLARSMLRRVSIVDIEAQYVRGAVALAAAREQPRGALLRRAVRCARRAARGGAGHGEAMAQQLLGAVAARRGRSEQALELLGDSAARFDQCDMPLFADACRYRIGELLGGSEGETLRRSILERLGSRGVLAPERMVAALAPAVV